MQLQLDTRVDGDAAVVGVTGEIDNFTAPQLREALLAAFDSGAAVVVVDLSATSFLDSSALGALVGVHKITQDGHVRMRVACPQPHLRRLFEISHLDEVIDVRDSVDAATAG